MYSIIKVIIIVGIFFWILSSNVSRASSSKTVNKIIKRAKKFKAENKIAESVYEYKAALNQVIGFDATQRWSLYEIRDNMNTNGWFILTELDYLYKKANVKFDMRVWQDIVGRLAKYERTMANEKLRQFIFKAFSELPEVHAA